MPFDAGVDGVTEGVIAGVNAIPLAPRRRKARRSAAAFLAA